MPLAVPASPDWLHEIKYDGYRLRLERDGDRVRLITRGGHNWPDRYPRIVEAARKNRVTRFIIDGEGVALNLDGVADFTSRNEPPPCNRFPPVLLTAWSVARTSKGPYRKRPVLITTVAGHVV